MNTKNKKLKIAIAGLGFGKKVHLEALKESDYLTPVAIYHYEKKQKSILEKETGLDLLIQRGYKILELETYFTSGPEETRAWTIEKNCTAPKAAGEIHTDFEKGFIRAETISYNDFVANNGWVNSKNNGKMRLEGKDYIVKDGDVLNFRFNT